jgi:glycosyltransferase involved in cell wall biosynthesis
MHDWELIIIDDGSADDLGTVIQALADQRVSLIRHDSNRGAAAARNTGIRASSGAFVAFIDSDDEWLPEKLHRQVAAMDARPRLGGLCTAFRLKRLRSGYVEDRHPRPTPTWLASLLDGCFVSPGTTLLARRECFDTVGLLEESLRRFEDWDWLLRLVEHYEFDCLSEVAAIINVGPSPSPSVIGHATRALEGRQVSRIRSMAGEAGVRRFRASLALERAHAAQSARNPLGAMSGIAEAALLSPTRTLDFLRRGLAKLGSRDL